jgi:TRAP-type C4-dicarboxylate transport system permease large subunit
MVSNTTLIMLAIVPAFGLLAIMVIDSIGISQQEIEAAKSIVGECASGLKNASAQLCHDLRS